MELQLEADITEAERRVFEEAEAEENRERESFHCDEVTPFKVALKPVKSAYTPMEEGPPSNATDVTPTNLQSKQPYEPKH